MIDCDGCYEDCVKEACNLHYLKNGLTAEKVWMMMDELATRGNCEEE